MVCLKPSLKFLYVNDDLEDFLIFREMMKDAGFKQVSSFAPEASSEEVLNYLRENRENLPDVVLLDVRQPLVDGVEVLQSVRKQPEFNSIPIILISGSEDFLNRLKEEHPKLKIDGILTKPISLLELTNVLEPFAGCVEGSR